jgi:hypothetical protein
MGKTRQAIVDKLYPATVEERSIVRHRHQYRPAAVIRYPDDAGIVAFDHGDVNPCALITAQQTAATDAHTAFREIMYFKILVDSISVASPLHIFGPGEAPHLGCRTQLGRDMVFGYNKKAQSDRSTGKFLQCF